MLTAFPCFLRLRTTLLLTYTCVIPMQTLHSRFIHDKIYSFHIKRTEIIKNLTDSIPTLQDVTGQAYVASDAS